MARPSNICTNHRPTARAFDVVEGKSSDLLSSGILVCFFMPMTPNVSKTCIHYLIVILCKKTHSFYLVGANNGTYTSTKISVLYSDFLLKPLTFNHLSTLCRICLFGVCESFRDLGVMFSSNLHWSDYIKYISSQAYGVLGLIRRLFSSCLNTGTKRCLHISLVQSQITYCSQIWRPHLLKDVTSLERIQQRTTKYMTGLRQLQLQNTFSFSSHTSFNDVSRTVGRNILNQNNVSRTLNQMPSVFYHM